MLKLKPLQQQSINSWKNNSNRAVLVMPTGSGKTVVASEIMQKHDYQKVLILVNTNHLIDHWNNFIEKFKLDSNKITVSTIQSNYKNTNQEYDLLIGDEAHRLLSPEYSKFLFSNKFQDILFLTCDITRYDGREEILKKLNVSIIKEVTHQQAINQKLLSEFSIINIGANLTEGEEIKYEQCMNYIRSNFGKFKYNFNILKSFLFEPTAKELIRRFQLRKQLLSSSINKLDIILKIIQQEKFTKCIIFCEYIDYAETIQTYLRNNDINSGVYHSKTNDTAITDFRNNKINILITCKALDEGFDIPSADLAIIASPTQQSRRVIQRLGRILRYQEGKEAKLYNIYVRNTKEEQWLVTGIKGLKNVRWKQNI